MVVGSDFFSLIGNISSLRMTYCWKMTTLPDQTNLDKIQIIYCLVTKQLQA